MNLQAREIQTDWVRCVRDSLRKKGYYYEPNFSHDTNDAEPVVTAARWLGQLFDLSDADPSLPVILTQPSISAPSWRAFDQRAAFGWHNDFSTRFGRPELSLSWIRQQDPVGPKGGAWRVASVATVLDRLRESREGRQLVAALSSRAEPFGYRDGGRCRLFRVIVAAEGKTANRGMRFYKRAIEEGAFLHFGYVPDRTREIIARVEEAADAVGEVLPATTGSLLIVDNRFGLHDRMEQRVTGPKESRRQSYLCFVRRLYQPL
jgi:hypothetical protein